LFDGALAPCPAFWGQANDYYLVGHAVVPDDDRGSHVGSDRDVAEKTACVLAGCWIYQADPLAYSGGLRREPFVDLPGSAQLLSQKNHDQIRNQAHVEQLAIPSATQALPAAIVLQSLQLAALFPGEETAPSEPFHFFTDRHNPVADGVREGRRRKFAIFAELADPEKHNSTPCLNIIETFVAAGPRSPSKVNRRQMALGMQDIMQRLSNTVSPGAEVIGAKGVLARWRIGYGLTLTRPNDLGADSVPFKTPSGRLLFSTGGTDPMTAAYLEIAE
jgi:hypothetical protein